MQQRPTSRQTQSILDAFGQNGWQAEIIEGREVVQTIFEAHHTQIHLLAQAFPEMNAIAIVGETAMPLEKNQLPYALELIMHANKQLTLGSFEYDLDRAQLVFRITNLFEKELYDAPIISSLVHCAIAELDRLTPYVSVIRQTREDLLKDLSPRRLLQREDLIPPVPGHEEGSLEDLDPLGLATQEDDDPFATDGPVATGLNNGGSSEEEEL